MGVEPMTLSAYLDRLEARSLMKSDELDTFMNTMLRAV